MLPADFHSCFLLIRFIRWQAQHVNNKNVEVCLVCGSIYECGCWNKQQTSYDNTIIRNDKNYSLYD
jgi:hypothetical protein